MNKLYLKIINIYKQIKEIQMPNHVKNIITVNNGAHKQRLAFLNALINRVGYLDFNRLV